MNTKIRCLLLDDELPGLTYLKMICEQMPELEVVKAYNSPEQLLREQDPEDYDLLISDIEMPGLNGLQVADAIKGKPVIFTTAYKNFAVDAFDRDAVDYVVKPVKPERLRQAVHKAMARIEKQEGEPQQIQLNTNKGKALIDVSKIFAILTSDIDSRDKFIILDDGSEIMAKNASFQKLLTLLPAKHFCQINKQTVLNTRHVRYYLHDEITADITAPDGKPYTFSLSEIYRSHFMERVKR